MSTPAAVFWWLFAGALAGSAAFAGERPGAAPEQEWREAWGGYELADPYVDAGEVGALDDTFEPEAGVTWSFGDPSEADCEEAPAARSSGLTPSTYGRSAPAEVALASWIGP